MKLQFLLFCSLLYLNSSLLVATVPKNEKEYSEQELVKIEKQLKKLKKTLHSKKRKAKSAKIRLGKIKKNLYLQERKYKKNKSLLKHLNTSIDETAEKIIQIKAKHQKTAKVFEERLAYIYKHENHLLYSKFFGSNYLKNNYTDQYAYEKFFQNDVILIESLAKQHEELTTLEQNLKTKKEQREKTIQDISNNKRVLKQKNKSLAKTLKKLSKEIKLFELEQKTLQKDSAEISALILKAVGNTFNFEAVGRFLKPAKGWISSRFGHRKHPIFKRRILHAGIDIAAPTGEEIFAVNAGQVLFSGWKKGYGNTTIINHGKKNGKKISSVYAHQSRILVKAKQIIKKGELIGYVGKTGYTTGPHLHFEIRENGSPINPTKYINF